MLDVYAEYFNSVADGKPTDITISDEDRELALKFIEKMPKLQALAKKEVAKDVPETPIDEEETEDKPLPVMGNPIEEAIRKIKSNGLNGKTT